MKLPSVLSLKTTLIVGAAPLAIGGVGGWVGHDKLVYQPHLASDAKAVTRGVQQARTSEAKGTTVTTEVRAKHDAAQAQVRTVTQTIIKEVPVYVPAPAPTEPPRVGNDLSLGFARLHDYAALGISPPVPAPSGIDWDAPAGVGMSAGITTIASNYGVCLTYRAEVQAWREWYDRQLAAWPVDENGKPRK